MLLYPLVWSFKVLLGTPCCWETFLSVIELIKAWKNSINFAIDFQNDFQKSMHKLSLISVPSIRSVFQVTFEHLSFAMVEIPLTKILNYDITTINLKPENRQSNLSKKRKIVQSHANLSKYLSSVMATRLIKDRSCFSELVTSATFLVDANTLFRR